MRAAPRPDGSLFVESPNKDAVYDVGNHALFAAFDGQGGCTRALLVEGYDLGRWALRLQVDGQVLTFAQGLAIGRLWELRGEVMGVEMGMTAFMEEATPIIFQQCRVRNTAATRHRLSITIDLDFSPPATPRQGLESFAGRQVPRLPGLSHLWGQGWAKPILPASPRRVQVEAGSQVMATGKSAVFWQGTHLPQGIVCRGRTAQIQYEFGLSPGEEMEVAWVLGAGDGQGAADALARRAGALREAKAYAQWLSTRLETGDALLQSMFVAGLNAAVAMFKEFPEGFAGLVAGAAYAYPPRLYFRDAYWTAQVLLPFRPELVRRHLLSLARGVHADGQCPSAVFAPHVAQEWGVTGSGWLDWLPDHYDAPPFLVLLLADYVRATVDWAVLDEVVPVPQGRGKDVPAHYRPLWHTAEAAVHYLMSRDRDGDGLVEKPQEANDWADNVRRSTWVCYDQALYAAVLKAARYCQMLWIGRPSAVSIQGMGMNSAAGSGSHCNISVSPFGNSTPALTRATR